MYFDSERKLWLPGLKPGPYRKHDALERRIIELLTEAEVRNPRLDIIKREK